MPGYITAVSDGDTISAFCQRRFNESIHLRLRLRGINTPELGTPKGDEAKVYLVKQLPVGTPVVVTTYKLTFDRYEAAVTFEKNGKLQDVGGLMIAKGFAEPMKHQLRKEVKTND